jgi:N-methylhydantoinase B
VIESVSPVVMRQRELRPDSGGPGRHRGGLGQIIRFEVRSHGPCTLSGMYDRVRFAPGGAQGGKPGAPGAVLGRAGALPSKGRVTIQPGEEITLQLPGGGGYGDSRARPREAVEADVREGYVTPSEARLAYGESNESRTEIKRRSMPSGARKE